MSGPLSKIINYQYQSQPADLINANPLGPVEGYHKNTDSNNQSWSIVVVGGNRITIQNGSTYTYASVQYEAEGARVVGSDKPYVWQQLSVPGGWYQIATVDGKYVWLLTGDKDYAPIILKATPYQGKDAQWGYDPTERVGFQQAGRAFRPSRK